MPLASRPCKTPQERHRANTHWQPRDAGGRRRPKPARRLHREGRSWRLVSHAPGASELFEVFSIQNLLKFRIRVGAVRNTRWLSKRGQRRAFGTRLGALKVGRFQARLNVAGEELLQFQTGLSGARFNFAKEWVGEFQCRSHKSILAQKRASLNPELPAGQRRNKEEPRMAEPHAALSLSPSPESLRSLSSLR